MVCHIFSNLTRHVIVGLSHPRSGDDQGQEITMDSLRYQNYQSVNAKKNNLGTIG